MPDRDGSCMKAQACATVIVSKPAATACILMSPPRDRQLEPHMPEQSFGFAVRSAQSFESLAPALPS